VYKIRECYCLYTVVPTWPAPAIIYMTIFVLNEISINVFCISVNMVIIVSLDMRVYYCYYLASFGWNILYHKFWIRETKIVPGEIPKNSNTLQLFNKTNYLKKGMVTQKNTIQETWGNYNNQGNYLKHWKLPTDQFNLILNNKNSKVQKSKQLLKENVSQFKYSCTSSGQ